MSSSTAAAPAATPAGVRITPVRAIPSSLAIKSTPAFPPSTDSYEPLVKAVLRHRLAYSIFLRTGLFAWLTMTAAIIWQQSAASVGIIHLLLLPFSPLTISTTVAVWALVALPVVLLRKLLLTPSRAPAASPASSLADALAKSFMWRALLVYIASASVLVVVHVFAAYMVEPVDPKLRLFARSKKHPHYLNGRLIFMIISQIVVAVSYGIRNIMSDRFAFKWGVAAQKTASRHNFTLLDVLRAFTVSILLVILTLPVIGTIFSAARFLLPILYRVPLVSHLLRPFTAHFLRGSWTIFLPLRHVDLISRTLHLSFISIFIWEITDTLFDVNLAKQISITSLTADPNQTLISGISSKDPIFKYFAYSELRTMAEDKSPVAIAQRTALFSDQKSTPTLWSRFIRESLLQLGKDYQMFLRRGKPEPPSLPVPVPTPTPNPSTVVSRPVPLLQKRIFSSSKVEGASVKATPDTLTSGGPISRTVDVNFGGTDLPEIFRSSPSSKVIPQSTKQEVQKGAGGAKDTLETTKRKIKDFVNKIYKKYLPPIAAEYLEICIAWMRSDRTHKVVERCLPSRELDLVIVEVVSGLTCASLTEDKYGAVQRDIPRILEALLSFLYAVEEYQAQVNSLYVPPKPDENLTPKELYERETLHYEVEKSGEVLGAMTDGLKEGVARIVRTFGDRLLAFKFPPRIAQKLQGFLDYC